MSDLLLMSISNFSTKIRLGEHTLSTEEDCSPGICAPRIQEFRKTERQKDRKTERQKDRKTKRQKDKKT